MIETERMYLNLASDEEMEILIYNETDPDMKQAYSEMYEG